MKEPFELHTPSVFAISSPLQVLCAVAAIRQLEINDFRVAVCYAKGDARNEQLWSILDYFKMYDRVLMPISKFNLFLYRLKSMIHRNNQYKRLFIGDFRGAYDLILGSSYVSDGSNIVYLDDGLVTVSFLKDIITEPMDEIFKNFLNKLAVRRKFELNKNLLTIYGDLKNPKYVVKPLNLGYVISSNKNRDVIKDVYIVGTTVDRYCSPIGLSFARFIEGLEKVFVQIRKEYPCDTLTYVPHGRDVSLYAKEMCERYGCLFIRPQLTVEMELLKQNASPKVVYGFTSSALYNIKKMFPETRVINIMFECPKDNVFYQEYLMLSEYYLQNGIELLMLD